MEPIQRAATLQCVVLIYSPISVVTWLRGKVLNPEVVRCGKSRAWPFVRSYTPLDDAIDPPLLTSLERTHLSV